MVYSVPVDNQAALRLAQHGAALLFLDVPEESIITIDQQAFTVGPRFQGLKLLPPGPHFIGYSASNRHGEVSPTIGQFLCPGKGDVVVRRWDSATELLLPLPDADEVDRYVLGVKAFDFDAGLAPYDLQSYSKWQGLSSRISSSVIDRVSPTQHGQFSIIAEADPTAHMSASAAEARLNGQLQRGQREQSSDDPSTSAADDSNHAASNQLYVGRCRYTQIPRLVKGGGLSAQQLTELNLDKSSLLSQCLAEHADGNELVGEMQFAFIAFLMGQSLEGFAQWKSILHLVLGCTSAVLARPSFFVAFLSALHAQLAVALQPDPQLTSNQASASLLGMSLTEGFRENSFLRPLFASFFEGLQECDAAVDKRVQAQAARVKQFLKLELGWSFDICEYGSDDEEDEFAPAVVAL